MSRVPPGLFWTDSKGRNDEIITRLDEERFNSMLQVNYFADVSPNNIWVVERSPSVLRTARKLWTVISKPKAVPQASDEPVGKNLVWVAAQQNGKTVGNKGQKTFTGDLRM